MMKTKSQLAYFIGRKYFIDHILYKNKYLFENVPQYYIHFIRFFWVYVYSMG